MSKTPRSSRTHSHSASRSRSRSDSRSRSRSRSSTPTRSRKHRYGSRSRSRSRSHSPFHNRGRKHPREYQNHREFRGYHRGFRRPYYYRGRGRGFFRGRFHRGGGGYSNYRSNNWYNFIQYPQQKEQKQQKQLQSLQYHKQHAHSPKRGRSRTPKKCASSPQSLSRSHCSDRSSSLHSHHSSSSTSSRQITASIKVGTQVLSASKESVKAGEEDDTSSAQGVHHPEEDKSTSGEKTPKMRLFPINQNSSPHTHSAVSAVQDNQSCNELSHAAEDSGGTISVVTYTSTVASTSSPQKKSPKTVFSGFEAFSNADHEDDTVAISKAFKKFLEEQKNKQQALADKTTENVADNGNTFPENRRSKCEGTFDPRLSRPGDQNSKKASEEYRYVDNLKGKISSNSFRPVILYEDEEQEEGELTESHLPMKVVENKVPSHESKVAMSARELFEEHLKRLDDRAWDDELAAFLINQEKERAASILSAYCKREKNTRKLEDLSPERPSKLKKKDKITLSPSTSYKAISQKSSETQEQEMFVNLDDESSPWASGKREKEFSLRMDSLSEHLARSSVLSNDWRNTVEFEHCEKKGLRQRWCNNLCRSTIELFAQHIISIVHYVTAHHFSSSGMTLSDRFAMYQRLADEKEIRKPRKSPEIHRRIDVSPSAFMRHSFLFDDLRGSRESNSKAEVKMLKNVDLLMNIEQHKKYLSRETNEKQDEQLQLRQAPEPSMESSNEKSSKHHKSFKRSKKKRECSQSSSSSFIQEEETESAEKSPVHLQGRECVGSAETGQTHGLFQLRIRGRGWNRMNCLGNDKCQRNACGSSHSNNVDWNSEQLAKSKEYSQIDEKHTEGERKSVDTQVQSDIPRAKGRFILRRPTISITTNNSNWSHEKFKASGDTGEPGNRDHRQ